MEKVLDELQYLELQYLKARRTMAQPHYPKRSRLIKAASPVCTPVCTNCSKLFSQTVLLVGWVVFLGWVAPSWQMLLMFTCFGFLECSFCSNGVLWLKSLQVCGSQPSSIAGTLPAWSITTRTRLDQLFHTCREPQNREITRSSCEPLFCNKMGETQILSCESFRGQIRADFRERDEDSNFSVFGVRRFSEGPGPLHWIAFPLEILTIIHWIASLLFTEETFFHWKLGVQKVTQFGLNGVSEGTFEQICLFRGF